MKTYVQILKEGKNGDTLNKKPSQNISFGY